MGKCRHLTGVAANRALMDLPGRSPAVCIDEDGKSTPAQRLSELRGKLVTGQDLYVAARQCRDQTLRGMPTESVVTTKGVTVPDDKSPRSEVRSPKSNCRATRIGI